MVGLNTRACCLSNQSAITHKRRKNVCQRPYLTCLVQYNAESEPIHKEHMGWFNWDLIEEKRCLFCFGDQKRGIHQNRIKFWFVTVSKILNWNSLVTELAASRGNAEYYITDRPQATHLEHLRHPGCCGHSTLVLVQASNHWTQLAEGDARQAAVQTPSKPENAVKARGIMEKVCKQLRFLLPRRKSTLRKQKALCVHTSV